jgi:hypothetical protein
VYYDTYVRAEKLERFLAGMDPDKGITVTHALLKAFSYGMHKHPEMNRYVSGKRLYQREKVELSFSMKKRYESRSPIKVVKMEFFPDDTLEQIAERVDRRLTVERSDRPTYVDKEVNLFSRLPRFALTFLAWLVRWLDFHNFLPSAYIERDPMFAGVFLANLGSFGMNAGFHHLYEYGNISIFGMAGKIQDMPVVEDGAVRAGRVLHLRWSYDERIDDGFTAGQGINTVVYALENPELCLNCSPFESAEKEAESLKSEKAS